MTRYVRSACIYPPLYSLRLACNAVAAIAGLLSSRPAGCCPPRVYDYYAGGSGRERTLLANEGAWDRIWLRAPDAARRVGKVDTRPPGCWARPVATPLAVAPTGFHRLGHPEGEVATAAGAARAGALFVLSTRSTRRIEDVCRGPAGNLVVPGLHDAGAVAHRPPGPAGRGGRGQRAGLHRGHARGRPQAPGQRRPGDRRTRTCS